MPRVRWTQKQDIGPMARTGPGMAFDISRGRAVLFGGTSYGQFLADTWEWDGNEWTQMADTGPTARQLLALVYAR